MNYYNSLYLALRNQYCKLYLNICYNNRFNKDRSEMSNPLNRSSQIPNQKVIKQQTQQNNN